LNVQTEGQSGKIILERETEKIDKNGKIQLIKDGTEIIDMEK